VASGPSRCTTFPSGMPFSDLVEKIEWCNQKRDEWRRIGGRAKTFFETYSTPRAIWRYAMRRR